MTVSDDLGTILGVWAHPDDECYLSGALMASAIDAGRRVVCVTATRGEMADPDRWPPAELARLREAELGACLAELGVTEHHWLDYPDAGCHLVDDVEAAARLATIIADVQPDTILTFGPDGMTGHPDHIAVSRWTERAAAVAGSSARVMFATHTTAWADTFAHRAEELNVMMGADEIPRHDDDELSLNVRVSGGDLDRKERAILKQESQVTQLVDALGPELFRALLEEEVFRPA